jgi:1-acyl-sn-glycerol-3-phosphate acyltransferase
MSERLVRALGIELRVDGEVPRMPAILVANHVGWIDPFLVLHTAPSIPVAKSEVIEWPIVRGIVAESGVVLVRRGDPYSGMHVLRALRRVLDAGASVLNFSEGTTTRGDRVLPLKRGIFGLAKLANVAVAPVRIDYADPKLCWVGDELFVPNALKLVAHPWPRMRVRFLDPVVCERGETAEDFADRTRRILEEV